MCFYLGFNILFFTKTTLEIILRLALSFNVNKKKYLGKQTIILPYMYYYIGT